MTKDSTIDTLLQQLKSDNKAVRDRATAELWRIWFYQKGTYGLARIERAQLLLESGRVADAEAHLTETIEDLPDFAEAWNRRAILYYTIGEHDRAKQDCQKVVELNPIHFGALHGLGLCHAMLGEYREAVRAFEKALEIQPHAVVNQRLILECTVRLS